MPFRIVPSRSISVGKDTTADNAERSGVSSREAAAAEHQARDDAVASGFLSRGGGSKNSERFSRDDESGQAATSFWDSIFGSKSKGD